MSFQSPYSLPKILLKALDWVSSQTNRDKDNPKRPRIPRKKNNRLSRDPEKTPLDFKKLTKIIDTRSTKNAIQDREPIKAINLG